MNSTQFSTTMNAPLSTYSFQNQPIRVLGTPDRPLFVAADVCRILEIANSRDAVSTLEEDEKDGVGITDAIGRTQNTTAVTESGLYALVFKSRKPEAKAFRKWVTSEVLPAIRKTGAYLKPGMSSLDMAELVCKALREQEQQITEVRALAIQANSYNSSNTGFFTVRAFANVHGFRLSLAEAKGIGKKAASVCRRDGITMGRARDELFGTVNSYPIEVLEEVFDGAFQKGDRQ
jgi:prophage antirepressor-like protein